MRAVCEACGRPQPVDWTPGQLCTACGHAVRAETRCFWCVKWTPASGKFCRGCGAAVVDPSRFGAARMLKRSGVDQFTIPKALVEFDPEQIENFSTIYQRHAAALTRHVDHVRFLETFLAFNWSHAFEDDLTRELPWPDDQLEALSPPINPLEYPVTGARSPADSLALALHIAAITPYPLTQSLALLARVALQDWDAVPRTESLLDSADPHLPAEAALLLSGWRVIHGPGFHANRTKVIDILRPLGPRAAVGLAFLGEPPDDFAAALTSPDPDVAFGAALATKDAETLIAAERDTDPLKRYAAAKILIRLETFTGVGNVLRAADPDIQLDLLRQLGRLKTPAPALRDSFWELLHTSADSTLRYAAAAAILTCFELGDTLPIARAAHGDKQIYQKLFQAAAIPPEEVAQLCGFLLDRGEFRKEQWGLFDAVNAGRVPANFVPTHWTGATTAARLELSKLAELQLEHAADEDLHRFLIHVCFSAESPDILRETWTCLYRWYGRTDHTRMGALLIQAASLQRFFGSVPAFLPLFTRFLGSGTPPPVLSDLFVREPLAKLLRYAEPDILPELRDSTQEVFGLVHAVNGVMANPECDFGLRIDCFPFLVLLAAAPELAPEVIQTLKPFRGTDLDHHAGLALERIGCK